MSKMLVDLTPNEIAALAGMMMTHKMLCVQELEKNINMSKERAHHLKECRDTAEKILNALGYSKTQSLYT